jgi:hypothetical protein
VQLVLIRRVIGIDSGQNRGGLIRVESIRFEPASIGLAFLPSLLSLDSIADVKDGAGQFEASWFN